MRDGDNLVGDVQSSTIHVSVQDLDIFQFKRVHLLTKDKTIFIGAWYLKVKAMKHVQQGTQGVMGRHPLAQGVSLENKRRVPPIILAFMIISHKNV